MPTLRIQPTLDTYTDSLAPTTNCNNADFCYIGNQGGRIINAFLRFTIPSIDGTITSANIKLGTFFTAEPAITVLVYPASRADQVYSELTHNIYKTGYNWTTPGGDVGTQISSTVLGASVANTIVSFPAGTVVSGATYDFILKTSSNGYQTFALSGNTNTHLLPVLEVTYEMPGSTLNNGLLAYWKLDESSGNATDQIGNYALTNNGTTSFSTGKIGNAADFGASNTTKYFGRSDVLGLNPSQSGIYSFSGWVKVATQPPNEDCIALWYLHDSTKTQMVLQYWQRTGSVFRFETSQYNGSTGSNLTFSTGQLTTGKWYHVAYIKNGTATSLYLNGVLIGNQTITIANGASGGTTNFSLGCQYQSPTVYSAWDGMMDECAFWDRAITSSEVNELYNNGFGNSYPFPVKTLADSLIGYWPLDGNTLNYSLKNSTNVLTLYDGTMEDTYNFGTSGKTAQGFKVPVDSILGGISIKGSKGISSSGTTFTVEIWEGGANPTSGTLLYSETMLTSLLGAYTASPSFIDLPFSGGFSVSGGSTQYYIVLYPNNGSSNDEMRWSQDVTSSYSDGSIWYYNGSTWTETSGNDHNFKILGVKTLAKSVFDTPLYSDTSIRAYYRLEGNSRASVGGVDGTDTSVTYGNSKFGLGATFNGTTSRIVFADNAVFKPTSAVTVNCWFKNSAVSQAGFAQSWSQNTVFAGWRLWRNGTTNLRFDIGSNTGTTENTHWAYTAADITHNDNTWRMLTGTFNGTILRLYVNGVELDNTNYTGSIGYAATNYVRIGCLNNSGTELFGSTAFDEDDVSVFGRALSAAEIADLYSKGINRINQQNHGIVTSTAYNVDENFETYATGTSISALSGGYGWTTNWTKSGSGTATIETKPGGGSAIGTKSLKITGTTAVGAYRQFGNRTQGYLSFWARINTVTPDNQVVVLIGEGGTNKTGFQFDSTGYIKYYNGSSYTNIQTYSADTWYQIEMEWDDVSQPDKIRYRINGGTWSSWVTIGSYTNLSQFYVNFDAQTPSADFWIDDIVINGGGGVPVPSYNQFIPTSLGYKFSGSGQRITLPSTMIDFPSGTAPITVMMWVNPSDLSASNSGFFGYGTESANSARLFVTDGTPNNEYMMFGKYGGNASARGNTKIKTGTWTHLCWVVSGTDVKYYMNGRPDGTATITGMNTVVGGYGYIGEFITSSGSSYKGVMQEVAVFNRVLSDREISQYYNFVTNKKTLDQKTSKIIAETTAADTTKLLWF